MAGPTARRKLEGAAARAYERPAPAKAGSDAPTDPNEFALTVGECIRRARQEAGWTQAELADRASLSANYVARLERGELGPSLFVAHRLAEALDVPLEALFSRSVRRTGRRRIGA